jgi:hypothetical protein
MDDQKVEKSKLLIVGDSFGTQTTADYQTWYEILSSNYDVTNLCQSGIGQYKIHQQLLSIDVSTFDLILVIATSPYRVHVTNNPFYNSKHETHSNCDFLYSDVESRLPDPNAEKILWWFKNIVDLDHCKFINNLIIKESIAYCWSHQKKVLILNFLAEDFQHTLSLDFSQTWREHQGKVNHLTQKGHKIIAEKIKFCLTQQLK